MRLLHSVSYLHILLKCFPKDVGLAKKNSMISQKYPFILLLFGIVNVYSQSVPYITFLGENIANNSFLDLDRIGSGDEALWCHTDLTTCCSIIQGDHRGNWFSPTSESQRLPFVFENTAVYMGRSSQTVELSRRRSGGESGIYQCSIATIASNNNESIEHESVFVGLYESGGMYLYFVAVFSKMCAEQLV